MSRVPSLYERASDETTEGNENRFEVPASNSELIARGECVRTESRGDVGKIRFFRHVARILRRGLVLAELERGQNSRNLPQWHSYVPSSFFAKGARSSMGEREMLLFVQNLDSRQTSKLGAVDVDCSRHANWHKGVADETV